MSACIHIIHGFTQKLSIIVVVHELRVLEGFRRTFSAEVSCNHGIGCAGRNPEIVLQNIPLLILALHQVNSRDVGIDSLWRQDAFALCHITGGSKDEILRYYPVLYDFLFRINILQKQIES